MKTINIKYILSFFTLLIIIVSCQKEIKLKQEEIDPRIVVNSLFSANDTLWVSLSESRNILYEGDLPTIKTATVKLLDNNDALLGTFVHDTDGKYYLASPTPIAGNKYKLTADATGLKSIKASSETPGYNEIISIDTASVFSGNSQLEFKITFQDDASQDDYYGISIIAYVAYLDFETEDTLYYESPYFSSKEIYLNNGEADIDGKKYADGFYFSDESFSGQTITFTGNQFSSPPEIEGANYYVVELTTISEDMFKYKVSYSKYLNAKNGFFAEPVQVYSNVENGFGIFGGSSAYRDTIHIE